MEWHKAKNVLILLFLSVNIFLLCVLADSNNKDNFDKTKLSEVFLKNNINIDMEILPKPKNRLFVSEFYGVNDEVIHFFVPKILKVDGTTYSNETRTLMVEGNKISFTDSAPSDQSFKNVTTENVESKLKPILKELGIFSSVVMENISESSGMYMVEYEYIPAKYKIFYNKLIFLISNRGILKCEGEIYLPDKKNGYSYEINTAETILVQFDKKINVPLNVKSIKLGLYILDYESALTTQAIPAYEIVTDKKTYIYDARIGVDRQNRELGGFDK